MSIHLRFFKSKSRLLTNSLVALIGHFARLMSLP